MPQLGGEYKSNGGEGVGQPSLQILQNFDQAVNVGGGRKSPVAIHISIELYYE